MLLIGGGLFALSWLREGLGLPVLAVLATVTTWYIGDAFYNDYTNYHAKMFTPGVLAEAWLQVALFVATFLILTPLVHRSLNGRYLARTSTIRRLFFEGVSDGPFQLQIEKMFYGCVVVWLVLAVIAIFRLRDQIPYYFFPFLGEKADPWGRGRLGGGIDALLSLAGYFQIFTATAFGLTAAVAKNPKVRMLALIGCAVTWPYFIFDRVRNIILAVVMPGILAWSLLRVRGPWFKKAAILAVFFLVIQAWFAFVIANRSTGSIAAAVQDADVSLKEASKEAHHEGLNMFEELCWINSFLEQGSYKPNWGARYFAELANPIPRVLWPGKPMIGIDYAIARGQGGGGEAGDGGVNATVSTGMIGQGVVNFGPWLGTMFAAFLMSLWAATLARLDLCGERLGYIPLYALGLIITFNLGRDITFLTLYTFVFGAALAWWLERRNKGAARKDGRKVLTPEIGSRQSEARKRPVKSAPFSVTAPKDESQKTDHGSLPPASDC